MHILAWVHQRVVRKNGGLSTPAVPMAEPDMFEHLTPRACVQRLSDQRQIKQAPTDGNAGASARTYATVRECAPVLTHACAHKRVRV